MRLFTRSHPSACVGPLCGLVCLLASSAAAPGQQPAAAPAVQADPAPAMAFAKVMMYPDTSDDTGGFLWWGRASDPHDEWIIFKSVSSSKLIASAYGLGIYQILGLPAWAEADRCDLGANLDATELVQLTPAEQTRQKRLMTQSFLADRYHLQTHLETRTLPVYELVVASGGLKVSETDPDPLEHSGASFFRPRKWANSGTMQDLAGQLSEPVGSIVIDKTGLGTTTFRYHLDWAADGKNDTTADGSAISAALEQQLGLKLVPATESVKVLVIDHIEKPKTDSYFKAALGSSL